MDTRSPCRMDWRVMLFQSRIRSASVPSLNLLFLHGVGPGLPHGVQASSGTGSDFKSCAERSDFVAPGEFYERYPVEWMGFLILAPSRPSRVLALRMVSKREGVVAESAECRGGGSRTPHFGRAFILGEGLPFLCKPLAHALRQKTSCVNRSRGTP